MLGLIYTLTPGMCRHTTLYIFTPPPVFILMPSHSVLSWLKHEYLGTVQKWRNLLPHLRAAPYTSNLATQTRKHMTYWHLTPAAECWRLPVSSCSLASPPPHRSHRTRDNVSSFKSSVLVPLVGSPYYKLWRLFAASSILHIYIFRMTPSLLSLQPSTRFVTHTTLK